jgi:hypothetical protein
MNDIARLTWRCVPQAVLLKYAKVKDKVENIWTKEANMRQRLLELLQIVPYTPGQGIPNRASPLAGMLVGGMAGAGLGYGLGWAGEKLMPEDREKGRLRKNLALLGAGIGAAIPAGRGIWNMTHGRSFNDMSMYQPGYSAAQARQSIDMVNNSKTMPQDTWNQATNLGRATGEFIGNSVGQLYGATKESEDTTGLYGAPFDPEEFNEMLWQDTRITNRLPNNYQAAASGLVTGAANLPNKSGPSSFVTPMDMARMTAGMGTGYMSGLFVGKVLGGLMGLPESTQETLKNTGMYAGLLRSVIPIAFGQ